ncbi:MAG TPA: POTRA domain-containing protein [Candidatus Acidoferrales bacterium]|nr:POTRA domain-containing protein [Candidatus Acidoferrales bacterium]
MRIPRRSSFFQWAVAPRAAAWVAGWLAFVFLSAAPARAQQLQVEGQRVAEVHVVDDSGKPVGEKIPPLPLEAGKPFDFSAERDSLRLLYRMGDYSDIRAEAASEANGLRVDFVVRPNYYNNVIRVEGVKQPPSEPAALAALRLGLGEPFRDSSLREAIARLEGVLHDDGLYQAKITWQLFPHEDTRQMDITVAVDPGPRARVGDIAMENQTSYSDRELLHHSKISSKNDVTAARLSRGSERLRKFLVDQGFLGAGAVITPGTYDPKSNRLPLMLSVTAGPRVRVEVSGARLSTGKRRKLLPIFAEGAVDEDLLQEGRRNVRDYFQSQGYFDVDVQVRSEQDQQRSQRVITYDIVRGDRFRLAGVAFDGNNYFSESLLARRLQLQPASFASNGRFSQQLVRADMDSIRALYLSNGFRDAQVTSAVDDRHRDKKNNLFVSFHIVEGAQTRIASLQIDGNRSIKTDELLSVTGSTRGEPYSEAGVASDRNNILALYYNEGFPAAGFREEVSPGDAANEVRLAYHITEGDRIDVAKVLLTGYQYTRPGIIARQVEIEPGGPLREGDVAKTQRQLYDLGVFNRVQVAPQNPGGADPDKAVVVEVQEGQRYTIGYGFGFEVQRIAGGSSNPSGTTIGASPRGIFEIARANMFGRAHTLSLKTRVSTLEYRVGLGYTADKFLTKRSLSLQLTGYADKTQDVNTFTSTRFEGGLQLVEKLSPSSSLLYDYFYRRVKASDLSKTINPEQIPLLSQPTLVSGFGITYARDRRDDPGSATRGTFNTVDLSYAATTLGSSANFFRGFFQNSSFYSFGRAFVFARSVRFGLEVPEGSTTDVDIPLPERFFAGGGTSLRGFGLNQAGPRDSVTGFPIGGLGLLIFNQELRFPMKLPIVGNRLGGTAFYDGGNVYTDVRHISFAWKAPSLTDLNYFSHTVGLGIRYPTPIGPVRVDFGYQLNPASYQAQFTPPGSTTPVMETLRLPHFGFFFNIGPIF